MRLKFVGGYAVCGYAPLRPPTHCKGAYPLIPPSLIGTLYLEEGFKGNLGSLYLR